MQHIDGFISAKILLQHRRHPGRQLRAVAQRGGVPGDAAGRHGPATHGAVCRIGRRLATRTCTPLSRCIPRHDGARMSRVAQRGSWPTSPVPAITDRWGVTCADLGASIVAPNGTLVSVFAETPSRAAAAGRATGVRR